MRRRLDSRIWSVVSVLASLLIAGCVGERFYRPESVLHRDGYDLAFIEFDDQGELWAFSQVLAAEKLIRDPGDADHGIILNVFVHGWQHNAAPKDKNVAGFESLLDQISALESARGVGAPRAVCAPVSAGGQASTRVAASTPWPYDTACGRRRPVGPLPSSRSGAGFGTAWAEGPGDGPRPIDPRAPIVLPPLTSPGPDRI